MKCINCAYFITCEKSSKEIKECDKYIKRECENRRKNKWEKQLKL